MTRFNKIDSYLGHPNPKYDCTMVTRNLVNYQLKSGLWSIVFVFINIRSVSLSVSDLYQYKISIWRDTSEFYQYKISISIRSLSI
jgi:hypothetical protein